MEHTLEALAVAATATVAGGPLRLDTVTPAVLAHLANSFLDDVDAASLGCANVALLHALRSSYDLKAELRLEEYLHVSSLRALPRLGRITLGSARRARIALQRLDELLLPAGECRLWHLALVASENDDPSYALGDRTWPQLRSLEIRTEPSCPCFDIHDLAELPRQQLVELRLLCGPFGGVRLTQNPSTHFAEFTQVRRLTVHQPLECEYADLRLPLELTSLEFGGCTSGNIADLRVPESLITLTFSDTFNSPLDGLELPPCLREIDFGSYFNHSIDGVRLPQSLRILRLGWWFDQPIDKVVWPLLHTLEFGGPADAGSFKQSLHSVVLPSSLHRLCSGSAGLNGVQLPPSITHLTSLCGGPINDIVWPVSLTFLELPTFASSLINVTLPVALLRLRLGGRGPRRYQPCTFRLPPALVDLTLDSYDLELCMALPSTLTRLCIQNVGASEYLTGSMNLPHGLLSLKLGNYPEPYTGLDLPSTLESLVLGDIDLPVGDLVLPASLLRLSLSFNSSLRIQGLKLPRNLERFKLSGSYGCNLGDSVGLELPPSLRHLTYNGHTLEPQMLEDARLPPTLLTLDIGNSGLDQSLADFRVPPCLARLRVPADLEEWQMPEARVIGDGDPRRLLIIRADA